ncbi:hypothetical protein THAOC_04334, partial [Thalassiosira oceanica]
MMTSLLLRWTDEAEYESIGMYSNQTGSSIAEVRGDEAEGAEEQAGGGDARASARRPGDDAASAPPLPH